MKYTKRKICVWSGKRGGFGALLPTMQEIKKYPDLILNLVVTDQHLYRKFGRTVNEVKRSIYVTSAINMSQKGDLPSDRSEAIGRCIIGATKILLKLKPNILLVIGDRGEVMAACIAAHNLRIPIAHVQGGDVSGTLDESVRHAITKLAHIHFPSTKTAAKRILKMGEQKWRIFCVGDTHVDQIFLNRMPSWTKLKKKYKLHAQKKYLLILQHSDSCCPQESEWQMEQTLKAVEETGLQSLIVYPCSDQGYAGIIRAIERRRGNPRINIFSNIPAEEFIGLQKYAACLIGNSSAGLIEAPYFALPAINIGERQIYRERCVNVINTSYNKNKIYTAIIKSLKNKNFIRECSQIKPPFGNGQAYKKIVKILRNIPLNDNLMNKRITF